MLSMINVMVINEDDNYDKYDDDSYLHLQTGDWDCATFLAELNI